MWLKPQLAGSRLHKSPGSGQAISCPPPNLPTTFFQCVFLVSLPFQAAPQETVCVLLVFIVGRIEGREAGDGGHTIKMSWERIITSNLFILYISVGDLMPLWTKVTVSTPMAKHLVFLKCVDTFCPLSLLWSQHKWEKDAFALLQCAVVNFSTSH